MSEKVLFRVLEKRFNPERTKFVLEGGAWHSSLNAARTEADSKKVMTLAHRLLIVSSIGDGKSRVIEEVPLTPLLERMARIHQSVLAARDPARLAREKSANGKLATWQGSVEREFPVIL